MVPEMKPHRITPEYVALFRQSDIRQQVFASYGKGDSKSIEFHFSVSSGVVTWRVVDHRKTVLETGFLSHAVEAYNQL